MRPWIVLVLVALGAVAVKRRYSATYAYGERTADFIV
jgi:hypothetical protein